MISIFLNDLECSLCNVCYIVILHKNNINKNEKNILKLNKEVGMLLPKKELIQVE